MDPLITRMDLGPVFWCEWRRVSRQRWFYALRSLLVGGLLVGLGGVMTIGVSRLDLNQVRDLARVGEWFFEVIVLVQLSIVLLAAPAATAGVFCTEMARGHVGLMLVSGMSATEIVVGTLAARVLPLLLTLACVVPVLALSSSLGGVPPDALVRLELVTVGTAVLGCSLALALSIGARRLHETLMAAYAILVGWVLGYPILFMVRTTSMGRVVPGGWTAWFLEVNPYWLVLEQFFSPGSYRPGQEWSFLAGAISLSVVITAIGIRRLKPDALTDVAYGSRRSRRFWGAVPFSFVSLDAHPVYWRECRAHRPSGWFRLLWGFYVAGALIFTVLAVVEFTQKGFRRTVWAGPFNGFQAAVGLGLLSILTPAVLAEERARGSLELLLSTPLSTGNLVLSKWCACYRMVLGLTLLPAIVALAFATSLHRWIGVVLVIGLILAQGAVVTSLGIALATWIARIDRALILSASASVLATVGWIPLVLFLFGGNAMSLGLGMGSPFLGTALITTEMALASEPQWQLRVSWALFWIAIDSVLALTLLLTTLASFDRCLGRISPGGKIAKSSPLIRESISSLDSLIPPP